MNSLTGKTVLISGGGSGVGLGCAQAFAQNGCQVVICGRNQKKLEQAATGQMLIHACDISDREQVSSLFEKFGVPDILINSAGINVVKRKVSELSHEDFDRIMAINCTGFFNLVHEALPTMRERKDGLIFSISSIAGKRAYPLAGMGYSASKFGVSAIASAINAEEADSGVRVTSIFPGEINTPILDERPVKVPDEKKARMVHPEDIASLVVSIAQLPKHVVVPELVITPTYQEFI
jgi:NADP-dependent 3-hydroxy acid dehydrogenase YdfG